MVDYWFAQQVYQLSFFPDGIDLPSDTGASSGFGKRFVLSVLSRGDRVIATASPRSLEKLEEIRASLKPELAQRLRVSQLDVTEGEEQIHVKIAAMADFWGRIDILVNNAGSFLDPLISTSS